jgi:2-iminobutanoate/2-iminopropanoate deaminase
VARPSHTAAELVNARRHAPPVVPSGRHTIRADRPHPEEETTVATKSPVRTDKAPAPLQGAPYSQAIRYDDLVFVSGQLPLSPAGEVVGTTIEEQTDQVMKNIRVILETAGTRMDKLVKTTVFLTSHDDFAGMNTVYKKHVGVVPPARSMVAVKDFPRGVLVEIDAIAHL